MRTKTPVLVERGGDAMYRDGVEVAAISAIMRVDESGESADHGKCMKFPASGYGWLGPLAGMQEF